MKRLIMCEGPNELAIIRILLENNAFVFDENDLLGLNPYFARQIAGSAVVKNELQMYPNNDVVVMRIGDKLSDKLKIPKEFAKKIVSEEKYCTLPELEVLLIISEKLWPQYIKVKSKISAKEFAETHIRLNKRKYNNQTDFYYDYFRRTPDKLVDAIREYRRVHKTHKKDQLYLADLLR